MTEIVYGQKLNHHCLVITILAVEVKRIIDRLSFCKWQKGCRPFQSFNALPSWSMPSVVHKRLHTLKYFHFIDNVILRPISIHRFICRPLYVVFMINAICSARPSSYFEMLPLRRQCFLDKWAFHRKILKPKSVYNIEIAFYTIATSP